MIAPSGRVFGVTRASTPDQIDSPEIQAGIINDFANRMGLPEPSVMHEPLGTSGRKTQFAFRPIGGWLMRNLRQGDTLIASNTDRLGRNLVDFLHTAQVLFDRGVKISIVDYCNGSPLNLSQPTDRLILVLIAGVAQFQADLTAQKTRDAVEYRRKNGFVISGQNIGFGRKKVYDASIKRKRIEWDHDQLRRIVEVVGRYCRGDKQKEIIRYINKNGWLDGNGKPLGQVVHAPLVKVTRPYAKLHHMARWLHQTFDAGELPEPHATMMIGMPKPPRYRAVSIKRTPKEEQQPEVEEY